MNYNSIDTIDCEIDNWTSITTQFHSLYRMNKPVCFKAGALHWEAITKWRDVSYLSSKINDVSACTLIAHDGQTFLKHEYCEVIENNAITSIQSIVENKNEEDIENNEQQRRMYCRLYFDTQPMLISDLNYQQLETFTDNNSFEPKNCGIWISSAGCITPLHYDLCHGLLVQIFGKKRFILASPHDTIYLYPNKDPYSKNQTSSVANLTKWISGDVMERKQHPTIDEAQWYVVDLSPGDILYTPPGWWHYVVSLDQSISILLPFDMSSSEHLHPLQCL